MKHQREWYVPKGSRRFADRNSSAVVYAYDREGPRGEPRHFLIGFHGRAQKPDFHFYYPTPAKREDKARRYFEAWQANENYRVEQRAKRNAEGHVLKVGDILRSSWGYDQTNVDYYEVTKLIGRVMVEIREIGQARYEDQWLAGQCRPMPGNYIGEPMRKRASGNSVRIASYAGAYKIEPNMVGGVPTYESARWSSYA